MCEILWINHIIWQTKLLPQKKGIISAGNPANTHFSFEKFKHLSNFCKILPFWVLNLMLELFIKLTHQISAVIDCFSSIIVHILMIGKNLNCLSNPSMLSCSSQCRRGHIHLRFHKLIIHSATRTGFFMPLLMIITITSFPRVLLMISSTSCIISSILALVFDFITERRDLKAPLTPIQVKREASKEGRSRGKSLSPVRHCWSRHDHGF